MHQPTMFLSVVIPAFNEALNIHTFLLELLNNITRYSSISRHEIIVIDDHSSDNTFEVVQSLNNSSIKCIRLSRRSGSHTALRAGLLEAKGDLILSVSADGQDNPNVLNEMLDKIKSGCDIVWALRKTRNEPLIHKLFALCFYKIIKWITQNDTSINLFNADFYLLNRKVVNAINTCNERNTSLFGLIIWLGFNQGYVEYNRRERISGKSKWNTKSRIRLAKDWIIAFSGIPLKLITYIGLTVATIGFVYATIIIFYAVMGYAKPGWAETIILILVLGGIQMIMLGITGEYLWRNLDETRKRPLFFIEKSSDLK